MNTMRVTSNMLFAAGVGALQSQQQELLRVQEQSTTGLRVNRPSDDAAAAFRHTLFASSLSGVENLKKSSNLASQRLSMGDVRIGDISESMMKAQDLVMKYAHSSVGGDPDLLKLFSTDAAALYQDVVAVANAEMDGVPLFGGGRTNAPFDDRHLQATPVRIQKNGKGVITDGPAWYTSSARVSDGGFTLPDGHPDGREVAYKVSVIAGQYQVDIDGVRQEPVKPEERPGEPSVLNLGNGVLLSLGNTPKEGDVFSFSVTREVDGYRPGHVQRQESGGATTAVVSGGFAVPDNQKANTPTAYRLTAVNGQFMVDVNGIRQAAPLSVTQESGKPPFVDLGNGVTFNIGSIPKEGDIYFFDVVPGQNGFASTAVQLQRRGGVGNTANNDAGFVAKVAADHNITTVPLSVKVSYLASNQEYEVDVNGVKLPRMKASLSQPPTLALGNGLSLEISGRPQPGDVYYFEVVPAYQGGTADNPVQVANNKTLPGNITGAELLEGSGKLSRNVNLLGALAALRGAFLRADPTEVAEQLDRIRNGGAQASDFQAITGVRGVQVSATNDILTTDEASLQEAKANNSEVDMFEIMGRLQKVTQSMQMVSNVEREVLNTSLIDFIR